MLCSHLNCIMGNAYSMLWKGRQMCGIKRRCLCSGVSILISCLNCPQWVRRVIGLNEWTALNNLVPTLPTMQICDPWRQLFRLHAASSGGTKGFKLLFDICTAVCTAVFLQGVTPSAARLRMKPSENKTCPWKCVLTCRLVKMDLFCYTL